MELEDVEKNKVYYGEYGSTLPGITVIIRSNGNEFRNCAGISTKQTYWKDNNWGATNNIRPATLEEIQWLEACEKANKFIPKEEALKSEFKKFKEEDYIVLTKFISGSFVENYIYKSREDYSYFRTNCDKYGDKNGNSTINAEDSSSWRYATSEEIAEYDRLGKPYDVTTLKSNVEFIPGKWYRNPEWSEGCYAKFLRFYEGTDRFVHSEHIKNKEHNKKEDWWQNYKGITKEIRIEEIQQYLPEGHVDKIVKEETTLQEAIRKYPLHTKVKSAYDPNNIFIVGGIPRFSGSDISVAKSTSGEAYLYYQGKWAEIVEESKPEEWIPKAGDYVFVIGGVTSDSLRLKGQVVKVKSFETILRSPETYIVVEGSSSGLWYKNNDHPCEFRKATSDEIASINSLFPTKKLEERKQELTSYIPNPIPDGTEVVKLKVIKDIPAKIRGFKDCPFIPKDSTTWINKQNYDVYFKGSGIAILENNRYLANIPAEYFEVIEEIKQEKTMFKLNQSVVFRGQVCKILGFSIDLKRALIEGVSSGHNAIPSVKEHSYDEHANKISISLESELSNKWYADISDLTTTSKIYKDTSKSEADLALEKAAQSLMFGKSTTFSSEVFQKGDKVEVIRTEASSREWFGIGSVPIKFKVGETLTIKSYTKEENPFVHVEEYKNAYPAVLFKKVSQEPSKDWIPVIGEWVTITSSRSNWGLGMDKYVGKTVQITSITNSRKKGEIDFKERKEWGSWQWTLEEDHYRKALPHEIPSDSSVSQEYKVRDWVILTSSRGRNWNTSGDMDCYKGAVVQIAKFYSKNEYFEITETSQWNFTPSDIIRHATYEEIRDIQQSIDVRITPEMADFFKSKSSTSSDSNSVRLKASPSIEPRIKVLQEDKPIVIKTPKEVPSKIKVL